ncbi:hypothetical protein ACFSX9_09875 [Flavobacterium ardleyense]|uniref:Uncharacterized protein n=1 Tax=Flavobacterium ardleyense TaxID=2038737 RepID=A0ABW5Z840_9FLAO
MKESRNNTNRTRTMNNGSGDISFIGRFIFSIFATHINDLFQLSKMFSGKLPIRYANLRV